MRKWPIVAGVLSCAVILSALALAHEPRQTGQVEQTATSKAGKVVKACAKKRGGALRIAKRCRKSERRVKWSKKGAKGAAGTRGASGANGPAGPTGAAGTAGVDGINGTDGTDGTSTGETFFAEVSGSQANFGGGALSCTTTPSGPSISFNAPTGAYIQIMAEAELQKAGGNLAFACLKVDGDAAFTSMSTASLSFELRYLDKGVAAGATDKYTVDAYAFPVSAGAHTVSLQYGSDGGQSSFRNRKLWVTMFQPTP